MTAVGVRGVYALGGEIVEFLEVGVPAWTVDWEARSNAIRWMDLHYDLLLIGVLKWFGSLDSVFTLGAYQSTPAQTGDIPTHDCEVRSNIQS